MCKPASGVGAAGGRTDPSSSAGPLGPSTKESVEATDREVTPVTTQPHPSSGAATRDHATLQFIGNATVLLRYAGFTVLTDPNFVHSGEQVPLGYGLSATRLKDPAMELDELPDLDFILLSHYHGDHFDPVVEERLDRSVPILTNPQAAGILEEKGFLATEALDTWEQLEHTSPTGRLRVTAMPGRHAPGILDLVLPDVMGSLLEFWHDEAMVPTEPILRLYISGDTIVYEGLEEIPQRHPRIDLALLHLGGTRVMGVTVTMDAEQGVDMLQILDPALAIPIHFDDYDAFKSPLSDFVAAVRDAGLESRVRYLDRGETLPL